MPHRPATTPTVLIIALWAGSLAPGCDDDVRVNELPVTLFINPQNVDFGDVQVGTEASQVVLLQNTGRALLHLEGVSKGPGFDPSFSFELDRTSIPPRASARLSLRFAPQAPLEQAASLRVRSADPTVPDATISVRGEGVNTRLTADPASLSFGPVVVRSTKTLSALLANHSNIDANVLVLETDAVRLCSSGGEAPFCVHLGGRSLSADGRFELRSGETTELEVQFTPISAATRERGSFTLRACDNSACETEVQFDGLGVEQGLRCDPPNLDFAQVNPGACLSKTVTCENIANLPVTIVGWGPSFGAGQATSADFTFSADRPVVVSDGEGFEIDVTYCPSGLGGVEGNLQIETQQATPHRFVHIGLTGAGGGPDIEVLPSQCNFGLVSLIAPSRCTVLIRNVGIDDLEVSSIVPDTAGTGAFTAPRAGATVIAPGESHRITVQFLPSLEGPIDSTLRIISNDQDEPEAEVRLRGEGINLPPCSFEVAPDRLSFGEVQLQRFQGRAFEIRNVGAHDCLLTSVRLEPGSDPELSLPDGDLGSQVIAPGAAFTVRIDYSPLVAGNHTGAVQFSISSARSPFNRVPISGSSAQATLLIVPNEIDFGAIGVGRTTPERTVQIYNTSSTPAVINSIRPAAPRNPAFTLTQHPMSLPEAPASIPPGQSAQFAVSFQADALSHYAGAVEIIGTFEGNPVTYLVSMQGKGTLAAAQEDRFEQVSAHKVDVLFVVNFSGSMLQEQVAMAAHLSDFLRFAEGQGLDYQIGVIESTVTTGGRLFHADRARGNGFGGPRADRLVTPATTPDSETVLSRNMQAVNLHSGIVDTGELYASYLALTPPVTSGHNAGFLRPDALLSVIYVSDEPDVSQLLADVPGVDVGFYSDFLRSIKGIRNTNLVSASAVVGDTPSGCEGPGGRAVAGPRYAELAYRTGGSVHSICTDDWSGTFEALSRTAFGLRSRFFLSNPPVASSLVIIVDGVQIPRTSPSGTLHWSYDTATNAVDFSPYAIPEPGAEIIVRYTAATL